MTRVIETHVRIPAARNARAMHDSCPSNLEGAGNAGRLVRPQPRVVCSKTRALVTTVTPETPGIPRAMVLTVSSALSPVTGLCCHRRQRSCLRQLDASVGASGPHDFAVRKQAPSSEAPPASTASRPASVTIASRPSVGRDRIEIFLFLPSRQAKFGNSEIAGATSRRLPCDRSACSRYSSVEIGWRSSGPLLRQKAFAALTFLRHSIMDR